MASRNTQDVLGSRGMMSQQLLFRCPVRNEEARNAMIDYQCERDYYGSPADGLRLTWAQFGAIVPVDF